MTEAKKLVDQLKPIYTADAWHGSSFKEIFSDISAARAAAKPLPSAHSIWEITLHIAAWESAVLRRTKDDPANLTDAQVIAMTNAGNGASQIDIDLFSKTFTNVINGNNAVTVVNVAQLTISLTAAGAVLAVLRPAPLPGPAGFAVNDLPAVLVARLRRPGVRPPDGDRARPDRPDALPAAGT